MIAKQSVTMPLTDKPGLSPDDPMSDAGRKLLAFHFARLLTQEPLVHEGTHGEAVHDMRVATRRIRTTLDLFAPAYQPRAIKSFQKDLRLTAKALGAVRDLEVLRSKANHYFESLSDGDREQALSLITYWQVQEETLRLELIAWLNSDRYTKFVIDFAAFVSANGQKSQDMPVESVIPYRACHVAPSLIYERYEAVRVYETLLDRASLDQLHELRIEAKGLRYTLEAFTEILGSEAKTVIERVKALQDHLGDLQDARVASATIQDFMRQSDAYLPLTVIAQYLSVREKEKQTLLSTVNQAWDTFVAPEIKRALALAISVL